MIAGGSRTAGMILRMLVVASLVGFAAAAGHAQDEYFVANAVRIHYTGQRAGEPIVLLHGLGGSLETWRETGILQDLVRDRRVIALDIRGHGKSDSRTTRSRTGERWGRTSCDCSINSAFVACTPRGIRWRHDPVADDHARAGPFSHRDPHRRTRSIHVDRGRQWRVGTARARFRGRVREPEPRDRFATAAPMRARAENDIDPLAEARTTVPTPGIVGSADVRSGARASCATSRGDVLGTAARDASRCVPSGGHKKSWLAARRAVAPQGSIGSDRFNPGPSRYGQTWRDNRERHREQSASLRSCAFPKPLAPVSLQFTEPAPLPPTASPRTTASSA
jgi:pimeloyl-ACP methyl ester carboxylesterase